MTIVYKPQGVCAREIRFEIEEGIIKELSFTAGCSGNLTGLSRLVTGMKVDDVIDRVKGIRCGFKGTSCPDQLAMALEQWRGNQSS